MATARDLITSALRKIHVLGIGSSLDDDEADHALSELNDMLSSFSAEGAQVYQETKETFSLTSASSYTIGSGADFNTTAPLYISAAFVTQGSTDYPLHQYDEQEYSRIAQKSVGGSTASIFYYDANYPTARIYLYPASSGTITLYSRKALTSFDDLDGTFAMPEHYKAMLIHNLAVRIAPEYEREASPTIQGIARKSKKTVMVQNQRNEKNSALLDGIPNTGYPEHNILGGYRT